MAKVAHNRHNKRLVRMARLFRQIRFPDQPVTCRRNRVAILPDGSRFFEALFNAISSAEQYILAEYYLIRNDSTGGAFAAGLADAAERGVKVFLIYDYIGCVETPSAYFRNLARNNLELVAFNTPSFKRGIRWFDKRDHRKMTIIDGHQAFLGGFNIGDEYAGLVSNRSAFRDMGLNITGSAVCELERIFIETWQMERDESPAVPLRDKGSGVSRSGRANVTIVNGGPHHRRSYIRSAFLVAISSASESICIATPYFVPGPRVIRSLLRAKRRGVRVRLLLSAESDVPLMRLIGRSYYSVLLKEGIEIFELERELLHAKVMLIDDERTVIGSANLDQRSFHRNFEINCIIDNSAISRQISRILEQDFRDSRPVTLEDHEHRGRVSQIMERFITLFAWFL